MFQSFTAEKFKVRLDDFHRPVKTKRQGWNKCSRRGFNFNVLSSSGSVRLMTPSAQCSNRPHWESAASSCLPLRLGDAAADDSGGGGGGEGCGAGGRGNLEAVGLSCWDEVFSPVPRWTDLIHCQCHCITAQIIHNSLTLNCPHTAALKW